MNLKKRKGVVLLVTLMLIMLLMGIVSIFLSKTKESKDNVTYIYSTMQTNLVMQNLLGYLKEINFDEDMIFYASLAPFPLEFSQSNVLFELKSAQRQININSFIQATLKDNLANDRFILLLLKYKVKEPNLFLDILKDTHDKDIDERNSEDSEIINEYPIFRNSKIYNQVHLDKIIDYYFDKTGDNNIFDVPFSDIFSFDNSSIDINFMSRDTMEILFEDANYNILKAIEEKVEIYDELEDLPFDEYYINKIEKGILGQIIKTKTTLLEIKADVNYKTQFTSKISFKYNITSKKITDYTIDEVLISN